MPYSRRFEDALLYAAQLHAAQTRKGTAVPYITHLMAVAALVGEHGGDEDQVIAGLLHDAPEDQGGRKRLEQIQERFDGRVARIVEGCTDTFDDPKPPWRPRKEAHLHHLEHNVHAEVLPVSAADKLHNARAIVADLRRVGPAAFERFNGKQEGTLWYYQELVRILRARLRELPADAQALVEELARVVESMHRMAAGHDGASGRTDT
jgi:(p)ppGpp synthase/HD superfamily hydrolase